MPDLEDILKDTASDAADNTAIGTANHAAEPTSARTTERSSEHRAIESLALAALQSLGDGRAEIADGALAHHATHSDYYTLLDVAVDSDNATIRAALDSIRRSLADKDMPFSVRTALHNAETVLLSDALRARYNASL